MDKEKFLGVFSKSPLTWFNYLLLGALIFLLIFVSQGYQIIEVTDVPILTITFSIIAYTIIIGTTNEIIRYILRVESL